jgi:hypothetical protein
MKHCSSVFLTGCLLASAMTSFSATPATRRSFTPGEYWLDSSGMHINAHGGGILMQDSVYYWFGEHKTEGEAGNLAQVGVHCYSSRDLYNWTDEGIALSVVADDSTHSITRGCILERPKVIYNARNRQYVMWFHLEPKGMGYLGAMCGIAVSDRVAGPYTFVRAFRPNAGQWPVNVQAHHKTRPATVEYKYPGRSLPQPSDSLNILRRDLKTGQMSRDMTLFVDDDGKAYHIHASEENSTLHISELTGDYLSHTGRYGRYFIDRWMEAPAMFKHEGRYYLIMSGCTGWAPNAGRSAVAASIWGPWEELKNPFTGDDAETSFHSQSTYVLPVPGRPGSFIYMGDRWTPENAIDGRYIWLPIRFSGRQPVIEWQKEWRLDDNHLFTGFDSN